MPDCANPLTAVSIKNQQTTLTANIGVHVHDEEPHLDALLVVELTIILAVIIGSFFAFYHFRRQEDKSIIQDEDTLEVQQTETCASPAVSPTELLQK